MINITIIFSTAFSTGYHSGNVVRNISRCKSGNIIPGRIILGDMQTAVSTDGY